MNVAAVVSLAACAVQLVMGLLLLRLAYAPGWRSARAYAGIALSAALYSGTNIAFALTNVSDDVLVVASRANFATASLHVAMWLLCAFGGPSNSVRDLPRSLRWLAASLGLIGLWIFLTGTHVVPGQFDELQVAWAGVVYRTPTPRLWTQLYIDSLLVVLAIPFVQFIRQARAGHPGSKSLLAGFSIFFLCAAVEVLVSNNVISTLYLADVGFLAVVIPVAAATTRRVVSDAGRLDALTRKLSHEVEEQTLALDRVRHALLESQRHAALGRLAAGVAHEINNPLTYMRLNLDLVDEWASFQNLPEEVVESLTGAREGTERIRRVVEGLRSYTRSTAGEWRRLSVDGLVQSAVAVAAHQLPQGVRLETSFEAQQLIRGDESRLVQVLVSLLTNSAQAIAEASSPRLGEISVRTFDLSSERVVIEVVDSGPGIKPEVLRCLATPYFTTRASAGATGLGLFLAREIVEQHGGRLEITSEEGVGTTATIQLLVASPDDASLEDSSDSFAEMVAR